MNEKCHRCGEEVEDPQTIHVPVYSPTGYPEDATFDDIPFCDECILIVSEGLDQEVEP